MNVTITENASSIYTTNHHLSTGLCFAELKLEYPEEIEEEIEVN